MVMIASSRMEHLRANFATWEKIGRSRAFQHSRCHCLTVIALN